MQLRQEILRAVANKEGLYCLCFSDNNKEMLHIDCIKEFSNFNSMLRATQIYIHANVLQELNSLVFKSKHNSSITTQTLEEQHSLYP